MRRITLALLLATLVANAQQVTGERKLWHDVVLTFDGPATSEAAVLNPFLNYRLTVTFTNGATTYQIPGYFAADGNAAETSATAGNKWRVHFVPDSVGDWRYNVSFRQGPDIAVNTDPSAGRPLPPDGLSGTIKIGPTDKTGRDHRAHGILRYTGEHYQRYQGSGKPFIQIGTQSPENLLAYADFDGTVDHGGAANRLRNGLHHYEPHIRDWRPGDPAWKGGKGKGLIGGLNYLAGKGMNTVYSLTMNVDGDGREIYPWTSYEERARYDVSKLAQWEIVLSHLDALGMQIMLITQEEENEHILGKMTTLRKLYYRELIARFAHHHALLWDLSEEMDRWRFYKTGDIQEICNYFKQLDPWRHPIQYVQWKGELLADEKGYGRLLGFPNFDGTAMQHDPGFTHPATKKWVDASAAAGHKWLVGIIEINPTSTGVLPDADDYWHHTIRRQSLWGNLMAGGSGPVFFFGYAYPNSDLDVEDWRSRDHFWDLLRYAHQFFTKYLPFAEMHHADELSANPDDFVFAKPNDVYAVYLPRGGTAQLDLRNASGEFEVRWYNPRQGGELLAGSVAKVAAGGMQALGEAPFERDQDWAVLVRRAAPPVTTLTAERNFLVKLRHDTGTAISKPGDRVDASIISPELFLGGYLQGAVTAVDARSITVAFHTLHYKGDAAAIRSQVTELVNALGHKMVDDQQRPLTVRGNAVATEGTAILLEEGTEWKLRVAPAVK